MTNKETVEKNIELTFDFVRFLIANPHLAEKLPDNCEIDFIDKEILTSDHDLANKQLIKVQHSFELI